MGREHDIATDTCGCERHHTYKDGGDMGASTDDRYWTVLCPRHDPVSLAKENDDLKAKLEEYERELTQLKAKLEEYDRKLGKLMFDRV